MRLDYSMAEKVRVWRRLLRLVFLPLTIGALVYCTWRTVAFLRVAVPAEGTVVALVEHRDNKGRAFSYPRVQYVTHNGDRAESVVPAASAFSVGQKVPVLYDPQMLSRI